MQRQARHIDSLANANEIFAGRFQLEDRILGDDTANLWRAFDNRLNRWVSVRLLSRDHPRLDAVRVAACAAARVVDSCVARVLDVLDADGTLVIVTEWIDGISLEERLREPMPLADAVQLGREIAAAICVIHATGSAHGRLRPASVRLTEGGSIRVLGHVVDAALWGEFDTAESRQLDIRAIGEVLAAMVSGKWGGSGPSQLPDTPKINNEVALPGQLVADVPRDLDKIVARCRANTANQTSIRPYQSAPHLHLDIAHLADSLGAPASPVTVAPRVSRRKKVDSATFLRRSALVAVLTAVAMAMLLVSARIFIEDPADSAARIQAAVANSANETDAGPGLALTPRSSSTGGAQPEYRVPIMKAYAVAGGQLRGPHAPAAAAIDTDLATSWNVSYSTNPDNPRRADGIILDLGTPRPVSAVSLGLLGNNTDLSILAARHLTPDLATFREFSQVVGAPGLMTLRQPRPVTARYLLVSLTGLPKQIDSHSGGITSVSVYGG